MKNANTTVAGSIEKQIRLFVRAQFAARIVKVDRVPQCTVTKNKARVLIRNPNRVLEVLRETCGKPIAEKGHTTTFKVQKVGIVAITDNGENAVLTLTSVK